MPKYSDLRKKLKIEVSKPEQFDLAYLTHYLQTHENGSSHYFRDEALRYVKSITSEEDREVTLGKFVPVKWDVAFPPRSNPKFKFVDLFAGIGGFRIAFQNLGGKCVFTSEWNYFAQKTYERNFGEVPFGDITKIDAKNIPNHDILLAGFPCQPFSIAGVSKKNSLGREHGFLDKTQGTLFFDVARIIKEKRPKAFVLENVKNLVSHDKKRTFQVIKETLEKLRYTIHAQVLDGKYYVPQHRERIFIVGFDKDVFSGAEEFKFPKMPKARMEFKDILQDNPLEKYTLSDKLWDYLKLYAAKHKEKGNGFGYGLTPLKGVSRTLSARYYKDGSEILIAQANKNPRRLTPAECARLQGYPDGFDISAVSDNQAYRQFGNSVVVPLVQAVGKNVIKAMLTNEPRKTQRRIRR
ncbi:MAG: DNA (cytosine-5-)-methyltransferase [Bacteroidota bacterium]